MVMVIGKLQLVNGNLCLLGIHKYKMVKLTALHFVTANRRAYITYYLFSSRV